MLKALLITQPTIGGATLNVLQLAEGINSPELQITVASPPDGYLRSKLDQAKIRHVSLDFTREIAPMRDLRNIIELSGIMSKESYDISTHRMVSHSTKPKVGKSQFTIGSSGWHRG